MTVILPVIINDVTHSPQAYIEFCTLIGLTATQKGFEEWLTESDEDLEFFKSINKRTN